MMESQQGDGLVSNGGAVSQVRKHKGYVSLLRRSNTMENLRPF
jgi:hypothetical protein